MARSKVILIALAGVAAVAIGMGACLARPGEAPPRAYDVSARAKVQTLDNGASYVAVATRFAASHGYTLKRGDFSVDGREVVNVRIVVGPETFFDADNFLDAATVDLVVHSHSKRSEWSDPWNDLLMQLRGTMGESNVDVVVR